MSSCAQFRVYLTYTILTTLICHFFRLVNANVYYTGDCPGWFHPILGSVKRENGLKGERVLTLALLVMLEHLAGDQIFREFWR